TATIVNGPTGLPVHSYGPRRVPLSRGFPDRRRGRPSRRGARAHPVCGFRDARGRRQAEGRVLRTLVRTRRGAAGSGVPAAAAGSRGDVGGHRARRLRDGPGQRVPSRVAYRLASGRAAIWAGGGSVAAVVLPDEVSPLCR